MRDYPSIAVMREDICQVYLWCYGEQDGPYEWEPMSKITDEDIIKVLWESAVYRMLPSFVDSDGSESHRYLSEIPEGTTEWRLLRYYYLNKISETDKDSDARSYFIGQIYRLQG